MAIFVVILEVILGIALIGSYLAQHLVVLVEFGIFLGVLLACAVIYEFWDKICASWAGQLLGLGLDEIATLYARTLIRQDQKRVIRESRTARRDSEAVIERLMTKGGRHAKGYHDAPRSSNDLTKP